MPLVSQSTSSYKGGVSQQPDIVRFPDQLSQQINGFSSQVQGLQKRPPTKHIKRLGNKIDGTASKFHIINRDENEQYILQMQNGSLKVWDLAGTEKKVTIADDAQYLSTQDPNTDFRAVTVADYTFILNRSKVVQLDTNSVTPSTGANTALVYIKNAQYAKTYAIFQGTTFVCGMITPDGGQAKQAVATTSAFIAQRLKDLMTGDTSVTGEVTRNTYDQLLENLGGTAVPIYSLNKNSEIYKDSSYKVGISGDSVISIRHQGSSEVPNIVVKDGFGNTNAYPIKGYVNSVSKLPPAAPNGYICRIKGQTNTQDDDYYVNYNEGKNAWLECVAPGIPYKYKADTMPHALVRQADGTFKFKRLEWSQRKVGDQDSNPEPSFVGSNINDIFFYRNRLGFISQENVILSGSADFYNFWFRSAASIADTDPIDLAVSSNRVSILTHAVPFARELMLFSREGQFVLSSDGVMTPKSAKVDQITQFDYSDQAQPIGIGQSIFFINNRINYCSLMRYYTVQDVADLKDAQDTSAHIPMYIPRGIFRLSGNTTDNTVLMCSRAVPNTLWVFKYIILNGQNLQQSWSKWVFRYEGSEVLLAEFVGPDIYLLINTDGGLFLQKTGLTGNALDFEDQPVRYFMDRKARYKIPSSAKYSDYNDETTVSLKDIYSAVPKSGVATYCLVGPDGYYHQISSWDSEGNFKIKGDIRGQTFFVGRQYEFLVKLSKQVIKNASDSSVTYEDQGRLQLRNYWFNYNKSGPFYCYVDNEEKDRHFVYSCTSRNLGVSTNILGKQPLSTGKFKFPIQDNNLEVDITVKSDSPLPINLISGGWQGLYIRRNSRV